MESKLTMNFWSSLPSPECWSYRSVPPCLFCFSGCRLPADTVSLLTALLPSHFSEQPGVSLEDTRVLKLACLFKTLPPYAGVLPTPMALRRGVSSCGSVRVQLWTHNLGWSSHKHPLSPTRIQYVFSTHKVKSQRTNKILCQHSPHD